MDFVNNFSNEKLKSAYKKAFWVISMLAVVLFCTVSYLFYRTWLNNGNPGVYKSFFTLGLVSIILALIYTRKDVFSHLKPLKLFLFPVLTALGLVFIFIGFVNARGVTMDYEIRLAFVLAFISILIITSILLFAGKLNLKTVIYFIIVLGMALRIGYTIYTPYTIRQHDVDFNYGHLAYMKYLADNNSLPDNEAGQMYHPPLHHALSAVVYKTGLSIGFNQDTSVRMIQFFMVFLSSLSLFVVYKLLKLIKNNPVFVMPGVLLFSFHPYNIYLSSYLNNDGTMMLFYILAIYYLIKWYTENTMRNILLTAVFTSCAIITKKSGYILLPLIFSVFLLELLRHKNEIKKYCAQYISFAAVMIPLPLTFFLRSALVFHHSFSYLPIPGLPRMGNEFVNLISFNIKRILFNPFPGYAFEVNEANRYFLEYTFKSSLFGEWDFARMYNPARVLVVSALLIYLAAIVYLFFMEKKDLFQYGFIFIINALIPFILFTKLRIDSPFVCSQNFRYLLPMLLSLSFFIGQVTQGLSKTRFKMAGNALLFSVISVFSIFSTIFILGIGL
ncbi:MAG: glycosyltransferase family 39 protein [Clostridiaceae bacterium]|nr:glycosyltransferase family 39 protein [Clostridiaceae bacterium]